MARAVRRSARFQAELRDAFGAERGPNGEPSLNDVERLVLDGVGWAFGEFFEEQTQVPGTDLRVLIRTSGPFVPMVFFARLVEVDGEEVVEMVSVVPDFNYEWDD